jgi:aminoglycoside phosphotransferase (APT) family kinase protein
MSALAKARARQALADAGLPSEGPLEPLRSVTNEVWLSEEYLVRLNRRQDGRLQKEMAIGGLLPPALNYPEPVAYGGEPGGDWLVLRRPRGRVLSQAWPHPDSRQRKMAVQHLSYLLQTVHGLTAPAELPEIDDPPLLRSTELESPTAALVAAIDQLESLPYVDPGVMHDARGCVRDLTLSLEPFRSVSMVHGDVHFENVMWDGVRVHTLLDWKWARPAPADIDLDVLLRFCAHPYAFVADAHRHHATAEEYADVPWQLADAYPALFSAPRQFDRMRVFSLAYDVRELLLYPPPVPVDRLPDHHPYHRIGAVLAGTSYLDLLDRAPAV